MTQGSVEAILSSWAVETKTKKSDRSFSEFLDERFKTALTFEEYPKEDRILVAKILASRGFLLNLNAKELGLPDDIFDLNTIKAMRGESAIAELAEKSGDVKHLTLKDVAMLDPFGKNTERLREQAERLLGGEEKGVDEFSKKMRGRLNHILGKEKGSKTGNVIIAEYEYANPKTKKVERRETITLDIEQKTKEFLDLYQKTGLYIAPDFEDTISDIWDRNGEEIQRAIEQNGFDEVLLVPGGVALTDLSEKMKMDNGYYTGSNFDNGGGFASAQSQNVDKPRVVLAHKTQNLKDRPELAKTLNIKGQDVNLDQVLTLEDYIIFQRKYFEETTNHLDEDGWTWLSTKSGARLVYADWDPDDGRLDVDADALGYQFGSLGARPSRSFF